MVGFSSRVYPPKTSAAEVASTVAVATGADSSMRDKNPKEHKERSKGNVIFFMSSFYTKCNVGSILLVQTSGQEMRFYFLEITEGSV